MEYSEFYTNAKRRTKEALLSMWAAGKRDTQNYLDYILEEEPILAEPVFQSMFPWESDKNQFYEFTDVFDQEFIQSISNIRDEKFCFPGVRKPYTHQAESWKQLLIHNKSIVVTSGTGSGKTECFMLPIIQDLVRQHSKEYGNDQFGGIQAIFLYPLNALMSSQQKRMAAWCKAVSPNVTFAMYKGDTEENYKNIMHYSLPELKSREQIRKTPPQILFTNPTMLEYMLVRKQDKPILKISKEKKSLRWIVLDEAHTYSGSSAAELALQIRRILDAFGVTNEDVRFAATSATLGSGSVDEYKSFLSQVTGKRPEDIEVIKGNQIIPNLTTEQLTPIITEINNDFEGKFRLTNDKVIQLRQNLKNNTLSTREIIDEFANNNPYSIEDGLKFIDALSRKKNALITDIDRRGAILPTRAHFFIRNMGGLYACVNPECTKHQDIRIDLGSLTTIAESECRECHSKLIEVNRCNSCGNLLLVGQEQDGQYGFARKETQSLLEVDNNDDNNDDTNEDNLDELVSFVLAKGVQEEPISNSYLIQKIVDVANGKIRAGDSSFVECKKIDGTKDTKICPHCGEGTNNLQSMYSGNLFSRLLAPTLLEQTKPETDDVTALWQGRKYISFTDNRQGTAKSSFKQNIEVEHNWIRTAIFHYLSNERRNTIIPRQQLTDLEQRELDLIKSFNPTSPRVIELERKKNGSSAQNPYKTFSEFANSIIGNSELKKLFDHLPASFRNGSDEMTYLQQLIIDQFGRRPRKAGINNPETMGLIRVVYPTIETAEMPDAIQHIFNDLGWVEQDWKDFLKISIDYFIRENRHIDVPFNCKRFRTQAFVNSNVYPSNSDKTKKFPVLNLNLDETVKRPNRLVLLLLLAMDILQENQITKTHERYINKILKATWNFIRFRVLTPNNEDTAGYKLNLLGEKVAYQILDKAWICPVNQVPLDVIFRGYSPLITSRISSNLRKYRITEPPVEYPYFPYAYCKNKNHQNVQNATILEWINNSLGQIRQAGLWSNMHERILLNNPVYLAAEHTAQQNKEKLRKIEEDFENNKLNVLSCSTTMEMGVDISGISEVVMNNVPPKPSNYLQRAGRAGRGSETKALTLTFCAPNPIGSNLFKNQKWAMVHKTAVPLVSFDSNLLVQRHINSFLLSVYIANDQLNNLTVSSSVKNFFYSGADGDVNHFEAFQEFLNNIIIIGDDELNRRYISLIRNTCKQASSFEDSVSASKISLEFIYHELDEKKKMLNEKIESLLLKNFNEESPATIAIRSQLGQILNQNILGFFAEHNFIPSAGIPTGIIEFDNYNIADYKIDKKKKEDKLTEGNENNFGYKRVNPSMLLTQAISEYAPGNQIVINEACYTSRGIVMKSQWDEARRVIFQYCSDCGYAITAEGEELKSCPHCNNLNLKGIKNSGKRFTQLIEPAGFRVDFLENPTRTIINMGVKNYTQPELLNMTPWEESSEFSVAKLELRNGNESSAEILYYNLGNGNGFAVCLDCGRAVADINEDNDITAFDILKLKDHSPIIGGKKQENDNEFCSNKNIKRNVLLGGRIQTDFVEIRFRNNINILINDVETIFSLGVVLTQKLAEMIGINSQEISFGVKQYRTHSTIFIFDIAKGGAGYSTRFNELKEDVIDLAYSALNTCNCEKACNKCLINRESQWSVDKLNRKKALEWLNLEIESRNQVDDSIQNKFTNKVYSLTANFSAELTKIASNPDLSKITFFINNDIENWKPDAWEFYRTSRKLRQKGITVCFAFKEGGVDLKKLSLSQLTILTEMRMSFDLKTFSTTLNNLTNLLIAEFSDTINPILYFGDSQISDNFDENWSNGNTNKYKVISDNKFFTFSTWNPDFNFTKGNDNYIMFDIKFTEKKVSSLTLVEKLIVCQKDRWNLIFDKIEKASVNVSYTDVYLKSPLSCRLLIDVLNWFVKKSKLSVNTFNLFLAEIKEKRMNDFSDTVQRDSYVSEYADFIELPLNLTKPGKLPHYRELKIENDEFEFIIRPDGGFENGWAVDYADKNSGWEKNLELDIKLFNTSIDGILYTIAYKKKS